MQTSARPASGLGLLDSYTPLGGNQTRLYYALREAVPIIDAAIFKTVRLTGGFEVRCADERLQHKLDNFVRNVPVGDVQIKVIGADNQILDSEVPVRQMLEQIVAKTGLPPFMLGLSWSSTERMSTQQADVLTSEIDAYRRILTPVIERICRTYLLFEGTPSQVTAEWDDVTLQDNVELARAELYAAQAEKIRKEIENGE